ncbi:MAG: outer membrane beta-barrel protein [Pseudomonadota bacterium]
MTLLPSHRQTVAALIIGGVMGCAHAQEKDPERLKLKAEATRSEDSNFLRAPESKAVADQISNQTLDVNLAFPYGQQRLEFEGNLINSQHQTLKQFDFVGHNYLAAWRWSLSPTVLGVLSTKRTESLNSAADSVDPSLRNKNTTKVDSLTAGYLLGGPWHLLAEYSRGSSINERALLGVADVRYDSYMAGFSYAPTNNNTLSYARRMDSGTNTSASTGTSGYSYNGHVLLVTYALTSNTSMKARLAYLEQRFTVDPKFDFSGVSGGLDATWRITGKTSLTGSWQRDLSSFQTPDSTYAQTDVFSLVPNWQIRPTLSLGLKFSQSVRDALGNPNGTLSTRRDHTYESGLSIQWQPRGYIRLRGSMTQAKRTSNAVDQDYSANVVLLGAQFIY